jgi:hypothetical protein
LSAYTYGGNTLMNLRSRMLLLPLVLVACGVRAQTIDTGEFTASPAQDGYTLHTGKGERIYTETIAFAKGYQVPPTVHVSLSGFDAKDDQAGTVRVRVSATKISKTGFTLQVKTWGDGCVNAVWGTWMAAGVR